MVSWSYDQSKKTDDIVVELVDARVPFSSKNPDIDELAKNKYRLIVLNKADMADAKTTAVWQNYFEAKGFFVAKVNSQKGAGMKEVKSLIEKACLVSKEIEYCSENIDLLLDFSYTEKHLSIDCLMNILTN